MGSTDKPSGFLRLGRTVCVRPSEPHSVVRKAGPHRGHLCGLDLCELGEPCRSPPISEMTTIVGFSSGISRVESQVFQSVLASFPPEGDSSDIAEVMWSASHGATGVFPRRSSRWLSPLRGGSSPARAIETSAGRAILDWDSGMVALRPGTSPLAFLWRSCPGYAASGNAGRKKSSGELVRDLVALGGGSVGNFSSCESVGRCSVLAARKAVGLVSPGCRSWIFWGGVSTSRRASRPSVGLGK